MRFSQIFSRLFLPQVTYDEYSWYKPTPGDEKMYREIHGHTMSDSERLYKARIHKQQAMREAKIRKRERGLK